MCQPHAHSKNHVGSSPVATAGSVCALFVASFSGKIKKVLFFSTTFRNFVIYIQKRRINKLYNKLYMAFNLFKLGNYIREESFYVDGTHVSKYSEKVLNTVSLVVYYIFVVAAILWLCAGVFVFIYSIYQALTFSAYISPNSIILQGLLALMGAIIMAVLVYLAGIITYSYLRTLTNISLSLKSLNYNNAGLLQPMRQQMPNYSPQNTNQASTVTCPECGNIIPVGSKACPECGFPLD